MWQDLPSYRYFNGDTFKSKFVLVFFFLSSDLECRVDIVKSCSAMSCANSSTRAMGSVLSLPKQPGEAQEIGCRFATWSMVAQHELLVKIGQFVIELQVHPFCSMQANETPKRRPRAIRYKNVDSKRHLWDQKGYKKNEKKEHHHQKIIVHHCKYVSVSICTAGCPKSLHVLWGRWRLSLDFACLAVQ